MPFYVSEENTPFPSHASTATPLLLFLLSFASSSTEMSFTTSGATSLVSSLSSKSLVIA